MTRVTGEIGGVIVVTGRAVRRGTENPIDSRARAIQHGSHQARDAPCYDKDDHGANAANDEHILKGNRARLVLTKALGPILG